MNDAEAKMFEQARKLKGATPEIEKGVPYTVTETEEYEVDFPDKVPEAPKMPQNTPKVEVLPLKPTDTLSESQFVVWTELEKNGFVWNLTLRKGITALEIDSVLSLIDTAQLKAISKGFKYHEKKSGFPKYEKKAVEYVDGLCPVDGGKLIKGTTKTGKGFVSCENRKYDFATKSTVGCSHIVWE